MYIKKEDRDISKLNWIEIKDKIPDEGDLIVIAYREHFHLESGEFWGDHDRVDTDLSFIYAGDFFTSDSDWQLVEGDKRWNGLRWVRVHEFYGITTPELSLAWEAFKVGQHFGRMNV
jgi:hypothetical protein